MGNLINLNPSVESYNQQVLLFQDEAFTLACHLLGNEALAAEIVQHAFTHVFCAGWGGDGSIRLAVLEAIIRNCTHPSMKLENPKDALLFELPFCERLPLLLVDRLGLRYAEAAWVLRCSKKKLVARLTRARRRIAG